MLGGDIFTDFNINRANAEARSHAANAQAISAELDDSNAACAANLAQRYALEKELRKLDPNHPLLVDQSFRERLKSAGAHTFATTRNWDAVREVGNTFKIPGYD